MSLQTDLISNCSTVTVTVTDTLNGTSTNDQISIVDYSGSFATGTMSVVGLPAGGFIDVIVTVPGNGVFTIDFSQDDAGAGLTTVDTTGLVVACDIDCCLAALTEELMGCSCDCPKCSTTLAKAQKIFLLLNSAIADAGLYDLSNTGYILAAYNKYLKAKEMCDGSCGCDC
tara:strand:+ start:3359 stop:3871 length:513 start_codon:yes stop_codon:yes gene_type:complete